MKKDVRLTLRITTALKERLDHIEEVHGVGLNKIANECLKAFCEYVDVHWKTPTFPLLIRPSAAAAEKKHVPSAVARSRGTTVLHGINEPEGKYPAKKKGSRQ